MKRLGQVTSLLAIAVTFLFSAWIVWLWLWEIRLAATTSPKNVGLDWNLKFLGLELCAAFLLSFCAGIYLLIRYRQRRTR
jgi:hypothetical protein